MGLKHSKCRCIEGRRVPDSKTLVFSKQHFWSKFGKKSSPQITKVETAIKAALLIQRWYRRYCARLEVKRRYTWTIFQSIEYAGQQDQMKLHNFFNALLTHIGETGSTADLAELLSPTSSPLCDGEVSATDLQQMDKEIDEIPVETRYPGAHVRFPVTTIVIHEIIESFKRKKILHAKYMCRLLREATKVLQRRPTVTRASTAISKQITVVGDLHGKLDDLLTILYKNGLPSTDNPYIFNGDFVDRGKKSAEVVVMLCALLLAFPAEVYLNRGNHEDMIMNTRYGFCKEINRKYKSHSSRVLTLMEEFYRWLPMATVIDRKVLVVHGGISDLTNVDTIAAVQRGKYKSVLRALGERTQREDSATPDPPEGGLGEDQLSKDDEEWKQVLDILWSDPQSPSGCTPNYFRGGGSYFGPDVTEMILSRHGFSLLIRSHECKIEGYEFMHNEQCLTIFSASNYYEAGSNKGAYVILQGDKLEPHIIQYMADSRSNKLTIRERVGRMESLAIRDLKIQIITSKSGILEGFKEYDPTGSGQITIHEWVKVMEERSRLKLPWRTLKDRLVHIHRASGKVAYMSTFSEESFVRKSKTKAGRGPTVVEALYKHKNSLETIFRLIDKDNSGFISMEEFTEACNLISEHMDTSMPREEMVDLAKSMDINKDGQIDFNEFLECFRIVDSAFQDPNLSTSISSNRGLYGFDDDDDDDDDDDFDWDEDD